MGENRELEMPWNQFVLAHMHSCCMDLFPMLNLVSLCWFLEISHGEVFTSQKLANAHIRALSPRGLFAKHLPIHCWQLVNNNTVNIIALWENFKLIQSLIATGIERREISLCVCVCVCVSTPHTYLPRKPSWRTREVELDIALERTHLSLSLRLVLSWFVLFSAIQEKIFVSQNTLFSSKNSIVSQINFWVWCELEAKILFFSQCLEN